eukprot:Gregarina_sp_Poly_1__7804@NODE_441_length_8354_cov_301_408350_g77_i1_p1_GENE_NODE_441_length_8354_cov_301_408350_g77_i1NODE_441_length_8354_cov_301_408350_g77_i1_p1_ORF_typecomplete_len607_score85_46tRNAsynt_1c/PF00749_21/2_2e88tRNAsynt_1c/PF00749_21/1_8e04tRNAsynt_1c_C/PF03950_18/8_4e66tRNAsynt_1/PF00133_22/0_048DUF1682/PF07946_14/6_4e03DUF1682/PF07946_14/0_099_NODE_441_length_8354_cov_301_408350_g77_i136855505
MTSDGFEVEGIWYPRMNNFITQVIDDDIANGKHQFTVTRFPPEPNGWLHLGHAKSICLNFGLSKQYNGRCHLRFDDTNPATEEDEYIQGIQQDVRWLGFDWGENLFFASDYFDQLYEWAVKLISLGLAYVDEESEEEVRVHRGSLKEPGVNSRFRDRPVEENLVLFEKMRAGDFPDGYCILRAKIDMSHGNMNMRDPPIYRIKHASHPRTGDKWCIYPIYDFAHGQSDSIEQITHSICTLEFYDHRMLYEWFQEHLDITRTQQLEFARFNLTHTVMSKRRLLTLVKEGHVRGWSDPRMPTLAACRRRGYPPAAIRKFAYDIGVAKRDNVISLGRLEQCVREALTDAPRRFAVIDPLKVVIVNWPSDKEDEIVKAPNHPEKADMGERSLMFGPVLYIEKSDFTENPGPKYFRLSPGAEVRLRFAYWIQCQEVIKNDSGEVTELRCTYDPQTLGGAAPSDGRKVKGVIHWVSERGSVPGEVRLYDTLFSKEDPDEVSEGQTWLDNLNPNSLKVMDNARLECGLKECEGSETFQFERCGFFTRDEDSTMDRPIFNLTVSLVDTFAGQSDQASKEAQAKAEAKLAREKAAEERRLKKEAKAKREAAKLAQ